MMPDLSVLPDFVRIDPETVRVVAEGVWFAWRGADDLGISSRRSTRHGVYWTPTGKHVVSLAVGDDLHYHGGMDFETYMFAPVDVPDDVCCHDTMEGAEACALSAITRGQWCTP